jgi:hypothetical protein
MKIVYNNHLETSSGGTLIVSSVLCPIPFQEVEESQLFLSSLNEKTVCCVIAGQPMTNKDFCCPYYSSAVYPFKNNIVQCSNPNLKKISDGKKIYKNKQSRA